MAMRTEYFPQFDLFVEQITGDLTFEAARALKLKELQSGHFGPRTRVLAVVGDVVYRPEDIKTFARWMIDAYGDLVPRAAYVVDRPGPAALMILLQNQFERRRVEVFSTVEGAAAWLGLDPEVATAEVLNIDILKEGGRA